jgi:hypothetical protein
MYLRLVWITLLRVDALVGLHIFERVVHEASFTSVVAILAGTVHQVLFRQGNQLARSTFVLAFQRAGGTECPTGTALALTINYMEIIN